MSNDVVIAYAIGIIIFVVIAVGRSGLYGMCLCVLRIDSRAGLLNGATSAYKWSSKKMMRESCR